MLYQTGRQVLELLSPYRILCDMDTYRSLLVSRPAAMASESLYAGARVCG